MLPSRLLASALLALVIPLVGVVAVAGPADAVRIDHRGTASIAVTGRGFGHGHGLSQYGAEGAAKKGLSYRQILSFYYPGLKQGTAHGNVDVLITEDTRKDLVVDDRPGLTVTSLATKKSYRLDKKGVSQWRITPANGGKRSEISYKSGSWHTQRTIPGEAQFKAGGAPITLRLPHGVKVAYRGVLRSAAPSSSSGKRDTVNVVPLDSYLKGVVPREAFPSWHSAALEAQAVAARTYAAFERAQPLAADYQICDTSACQVYGGYSSEVASTSKAVNATRGQILTAQGKAAFTQFSASNGGWMAAGSEPYLVAKKDPYDKAYRNWQATVSAKAIEHAFPAIGTFVSAKVLQRDGHGKWNGRVLSMQVTGSAGSTTISGDTFRSVFGLMSNWFTLG